MGNGTPDEDEEKVIEGKDLLRLGVDTQEGMEHASINTMPKKWDDQVKEFNSKIVNNLVILKASG